MHTTPKRLGGDCGGRVEVGLTAQAIPCEPRSLELNVPTGFQCLSARESHVDGHVATESADVERRFNIDRHGRTGEPADRTKLRIAGRHGDVGPLTLNGISGIR